MGAFLSSGADMMGQALIGKVPQKTRSGNFPLGTGGGWIVSFLLWLVVYVVVAGTGWLIPPMQSPDEIQHIARADFLSRGGWLLQRQTAQSSLLPSTGSDVATAPVASGSLVDKNLLKFMQAYIPVITDPGYRMSTSEASAVHALRWSGETVFMETAGAGYYLPVIYFPHAAAMALGRAMDLTIAATYLLVRLSVLAITVALFATAFRIWPPNWMTLGVILMPMALFQAMSPVLDGIAMGLTAVVISLFATEFRSVRMPGIMSALVVGALLVVLIGARIHLAPLWLLMVYLALRRQSGVFALASVLVLGILLWWVAFSTANTVDPRVVLHASPPEIARFYAGNPAALVNVFVGTFSDPNRLDFYWKSFIGIFGWLDSRLPTYGYIGLTFFFCLMILAALQSWRSQRRDHVLLLAICAVGSAAIVFLALLVTWTPHPAQAVDGVQGRYLLLPALIASYALSFSQPLSIEIGRARGGWILGGLFAAASLYFLVTTLIARYH